MERTERVAIVGIGAIFPGATDPEQFWSNIARGIDSTTEVPPSRWSIARESAYNQGIARPDKVYATRGGFVDHDELDRGQYSIDPEFLDRLDPAYLLGLYAARQAWESTRHQAIDRSRVGVIIGHLILPTETSSGIARDVLGRQFERGLGIPVGPAPVIEPFNALPAGLPAHLIAQDLSLGGTTFTLDAACASSLYALKLAVDELLAHRADAMLTGGLSRPDPLYTQMGFSQLRALSPRGVASPLSSEADGLVVGEGAGIYLLKRLSDAIKAGDTIHGVICGIGLSNDVQGNLLAPSSEGQLRAMTSAYLQAGWEPSDVSLIECHATGTPVGDAVEINSLTTLWDQYNDKKAVVGSVKSNIGHALTAANSAGLLKVLMALRHETLPPTANYTSPAKALSSGETPFRVLTDSEPWPKSAGHPRRAAISGFGFGGINAHALIEEYQLETIIQESVACKTVPLAIVGIGAMVGTDENIDTVRARLLKGEKPNTHPSLRWWGLEAAATAGVGLAEVELNSASYRIPPKELEAMLPQQALMLEAAAQAISQAGWKGEEARLRSSVFVGISLDLNSTNFHVRWTLGEQVNAWNRELGWNLDDNEIEERRLQIRDAIGPALTADRTMGALGGIVASRLAREFRLGGPCFTLSADETSGLKALKVAQDLLSQGTIDEAIVGAVELANDPRLTLARRELGLTTSGADAAVAFVVKRLDDATRAGDHILAIVDSIHDQKNNLFALDNDSVTFTHLDTTLGQAGAATGLLSLAQAVFALDSKILPPGIGEAKCPQFWLHNRAEGPRTAVVDIVGIDEVRTQVLLHEHIDTDSVSIEPLTPFGSRPASLFVIESNEIFGISSGLDQLDAISSSHQGEACSILAQRWSAALPRDKQARLALTIVAEDGIPFDRLIHEARRKLDDQSARPGSLNERVHFSLNPLGRSGIAFVYPGSGAGFAGMGRALSAQWPEVIRIQEQSNQYLKDQLGPGTYWNTDFPDAFHDHSDPILGQVAFGSFITDLLGLFQLRPDAAIGYSLGETSALFALKAWTQRDMMLDRVKNSPLFSSELAGPCLAARRHWKLDDGDPVDWVAGIVSASSEAVDRSLSGIDRAYKLIVNSSEECVIGGQRATISRVVHRLGVAFLPLPIVSTVHCPIVNEVSDAYRNLHLLKTTPPPGVRFYGGAMGQAYELNEQSAADSILAHATHGFDFQKVIEQAYADGIRHFVEVGPGSSCSRVISMVLAGKPHLAASASPQEGEPTAVLLSLLGRLISERVPLDLSKLQIQKSKSSVSTTPYRPVRIPVGGDPFVIPPLPGKAPEQVSQPQPKVLSTPAEPVPSSVPQPPLIPSHVEPLPVMTAPLSTQEPLAPSLDVMTRQWLATTEAVNSAHEAYLKVSTDINASLGDQISYQMKLIQALVARGGQVENISQPLPLPATFTPRPAASPAARLNREQCLEFAIGSIAKVLGPEFAPVDAYPTRVRLPDEPLMLVDRILTIEGEPRSLSHGRVVTEHDIDSSRWYLDHGRIPTCIAVESGQADLFLSGYLGIDFETKGLAVYRLLDAVVTFYRSLPGPGETIHYDIHIDKFFQQGDTHLFRFRFEGTVNGEPLLSMTEGCAGFFTESALAAGQGIVSPTVAREGLKLRPADRDTFVPIRPCSLTSSQVDALRLGDLVGAFGPEFADLPLVSPSRLPGGLMTLVERVLKIEPEGGKFGLGFIQAEADIDPKAWFMTCHFVDDRVMPGTLMYECCLHTLRILLTRMGWVGEAHELVWEPVPGVASRLKCRGQVIESTKVVRYEVTVKEIGYRPEPYVICDALMYADGKPIVEIGEMSIRMSGMSKERFRSIWAGRSATPPRALFDTDRITAFAIGDPSYAFGEPYRIFDRDRVIARLPGPPYQFLDRITKIACEPWKMVAGGVIEAEYDVPPDAWYFASDRQPRMPFAVLLEAALQPCGWLAAYVGSALTSPIDLSFRNLGGSATQFRPVDGRTGTLTTTVKITRVSHSGGMIIQNYDYQVRDRVGVVYEGDTYFGFFSKAALADQVGLRDVAFARPSESDLANARSIEFPTQPPFPDDALRMLDRIDAFVPNGGPAGLGYLRATKLVDPTAWFFKAHFHQDPVVPGSLGLESLLQALKVFAADRWGVEPTTVFESIGIGEPHRWVYRGQVIPTNRLMTTEANIMAIDDERRTLKADGLLSVDGRHVYHMLDFTLRRDAETR